MFKHIVNVNWLSNHLEDDNVRIVDCRFSLMNPLEGLNLYVKEHISGALYFDLEKDLSAPVQAHGGRHPLPPIDEFINKLESAGIDKATTVVAYDDQGGMFASRFWWLLQFVGHEKTFILDGGFTEWKKQGLPVNGEIPLFDKKILKPDLQYHMLATVSDVHSSQNDENIELVDSREEMRYLGIEEPIDKKAGHIPKAVNRFWKDCLDENGAWKKKELLIKHFSPLHKEKEIIVYCGSGVSACPNIISLSEAGYKNVKLYVGSWSDWISYPDNKIETTSNT